ncbi:hypothetical protein OEZ86_006818 [Tetradesmus obliquus]|nr:hypothetical protein OEZ86_006818 [Tetradesmus obliquus]
MNTAATTRDALWAGVHTAVDSNVPSDLQGQHLKDLQADGAAAMDIDTAPARDTAQPPAGPGSTETTPASTLPGSSDALLKSIAAAADSAEHLDVRAPPAAASLAWQPQPDGNVTLTPAVAAMADADDPGEDDVDQLQPDDYEYDDDVAAVGGDILGVGPTYGTVAGDPTQNLGGLGPQLQQQLLHGGSDQAGTHAGSSSGRGLSEGDVDVRGRHVRAVAEDAELPLRPAAGTARGSGGSGGLAGGLAGGKGGGLAAAAEEYSPEGLDVLDAGAIAAGGDFVSQPYVRHRSAGHTGIDPDPRQRPDPNPKRGLGLEGGSTAHPVDRAGDFAMGTVAVPAFGADAAAVRGLEYTDEPKYAAEVDVDLQARGADAADEGMVGTRGLGKAAAGGEDAAAGVSGGGTAAAAGGQGEGAAAVADVGRVAGGTGIEGSGPVLLQHVGAGQLQQRGIAAATAAQPSSATDLRHLGAIFGADPSSS